MKKNQNVYYVPCVRFKEDYKWGSMVSFKKGEEFVIDDDNMTLHNPDNEVSIIQHSQYANNIWTVPMEVVEMFVKVVKPKYKIGDIVLKKGTMLPFRIFEYSLSCGQIWYRDGWSMVTDYAGGATENNIDLCPKDHKQMWSATHYDKDVIKKYPNLSYAIIR
jgi:hypothetical protein